MVTGNAVLLLSSKVPVGVEVQIQSFLISALDRGDNQCLRAGENPVQVTRAQRSGSRPVAGSEYVSCVFVFLERVICN